MKENNSSDPQTTEIKPHTVSSKPSRQLFAPPSFNRPSIKKMSRPSKRWQPAILAVVFVLVAGLSGFGGALLETKTNEASLTSGSLTSQKKIVTSQSQLINQIAKTAGPSVVSVNVSVTSANSSSDVFGDIFGSSQPREQQGAGTGVIISKSGIVMTNRHVVPEGTSKVSVTLSDGVELKDVSVVGRTNSSDSLDVAFLKINNSEKHSLVAASLGDSSAVQVGDAVVAIGNALGQFQNTVTSGIISGYGRSVQARGSDSTPENLDNLFQTDAAINAGNSGGPLVNMNGQVIGLNTAVASNSQNIGFAIPLDDLKGLINQVLDSGKISKPYLGVRYVPLTADVASEYNLKVTKGAFIPPNDPVDGEASAPSVIAGSPADKAGLRGGDVITQVSGINIDQTHSLTSLLGKHQPGDKVTLTIVRDGKMQRITATLGTLPNAL